MANSPCMDARQAALQALEQVDPVRQMVQPALDRVLGLTEQRGRCTDLVMGVLRNRKAIDRVITSIGGASLDRIQRPLLNIIRMAVYELVYCPQTPVYAMVDEAVRLAGAGYRSRQAGFVNAILRKIVRHTEDRQVRISNDINLLKILPTTPQTGCLFDIDLLPEPGSADYLAMAFSLPRWLAADWLARLGQEKAFQCGLASIRRPSVYLQPNLAKTSLDGLLSKLVAAGIQAHPCPPNSIRLTSPGPVDQLPGYAEGLFFVQDPAAAEVTQYIKPRPGQAILDLCAAPGGKAIRIIQDCQGLARLVATDIDPHRLEILQGNLTRLGLGNVQVVPFEGFARYVDEHGPFDTVLVDAPCSNTGVLARRIEVRYRLRPDGVRRLAATGMGLLQKARSLIGPGGRIVYSTCSIQQQESEDVVMAFVQGNADLAIESQHLILPSAGPFDHDGGYVGVIEIR